MKGKICLDCLGANWRIMKSCKEIDCAMKQHTIFATRYNRILMQIEDLRKESIRQAKEIAKTYGKPS